MIKYFCDICGKEVRKAADDLDNVKIVIDNHHNYYAACNHCREELNNHILKIQEESKNGNT